MFKLIYYLKTVVQQAIIGAKVSVNSFTTKKLCNVRV